MSAGVLCSQYVHNFKELYQFFKGKNSRKSFLNWLYVRIYFDLWLSWIGPVSAGWGITEKNKGEIKCASAMLTIPVMVVIK